MHLNIKSYLLQRAAGRMLSLASSLLLFLWCVFMWLFLTTTRPRSGHSPPGRCLKNLQPIWTSDMCLFFNLLPTCDTNQERGDYLMQIWAKGRCFCCVWLYFDVRGGAEVAVLWHWGLGASGRLYKAECSPSGATCSLRVTLL